MRVRMGTSTLVFLVALAAPIHAQETTIANANASRSVAPEETADRAFEALSPFGEDRGGQTGDPRATGTPSLARSLSAAQLTSDESQPLREVADQGEGTNRFLFEAGLVGGNSPACPGHYVSVHGHLAGPVSLYAMQETYRCVDFAGSASRLGAAVRLGSSEQLIRPELRGGFEYDGGNVSETLGVGLTLGRKYGARISVDRGFGTGGPDIVLVHLGGYITF